METILGKSQKENLIGKQFKRLTVVKRSLDPCAWGKERMWICKCQCGKECIISTRDLKKRKSCGCDRSSTWKDYTGRTFGVFTVIECLIPSNGKNNGGIWKSRCKCGVTFKCTGYELHSKGSCGCVRKESHIRIGLIQRKPRKSTLRAQYRNHKDGAISRGFSYLSLKEWEKIVYLPCCYCGEIDVRNNTTAPSYAKRYKKGLSILEIEESAVKMNGIDRIDSSIGYTATNVVACCKMCNVMKMHHSINDFLKKVKQIYNYLKL